MADANRLLVDNLAIVIAALGLLLLAVLVLLAVQSVRLGRALERYRRLVPDGAGGSLSDVLERHVGRVSRAVVRLDEFDRRLRVLEARPEGSVHIGLVRFNPFEDTGSDQSFAIALLDARRDGVVLSSLHGRSSTRVFAKPVDNGGSRLTLSDEEAEAIRIAVNETTPAPEQ